MKTSYIATFILISSLLIVSLAQTDYKNIVIERAHREVDLNGRYTQTEVKLDIKNVGNDAVSEFYYAIPRELVNNTVLVLLESNDGQKQGRSVQDISLASFNASLLLFNLDSPLAAGQTRTIVLQETFFNRFEPYPKKITISQDQLVRFRDNKYFFSPYFVQRQSANYLVKSTIKSHTDDDSATQAKNSIQYGDYTKTQPFSKGEIVIHYENNTPLVVLKKVTKTIQVSHWGNIAIETAYKLANQGATLTGEFGRVDYNKWSPQSGKSALKSLNAELPYTASGLYYLDEIGNISTSHAARSPSDKVVKLEIQPRFPIFGGWQSNWVVGYNLNTSRYLKNEGNRYVLKQLFGYPFVDLIAEDYELQIILPEGAFDLNIEIPFGIDSQKVTNTFSYLDTDGRPTFVLTKRLVTDFHNQDFYISYRLSQTAIYRKPLLILLAITTFFLGLILLRRVELETFQSKEE